MGQRVDNNSMAQGTYYEIRDINQHRTTCRKYFCNPIHTYTLWRILGHYQIKSPYKKFVGRNKFSYIYIDQRSVQAIYITQNIPIISWLNSHLDNLIWSTVSFHWRDYHWLDIDCSIRIMGNNKADLARKVCRAHSHWYRLGLWVIFGV